MRDYLYEQEISKHVERMSRILNEYHDMLPNWSEKDLLGIERALQSLIEALIGSARYTVDQCYNLHLSRSREAIDELRNRDVLAFDEHQKILKIIGFRNILVHDYLSLNENITRAIVKQKEYQFIKEIFYKLKELLESSGIVEP